jgi:hypothetical protein
MRVRSAVLVTLLGVAVAALATSMSTTTAQFQPKIEIPDWENSVRFELVVSQEPVRPGDEFELGLLAEIDPGYHLYGPEEDEPSRTKVEVRGKGVELVPGEARFPPVITRNLEGLGEYDLYEGTIAIRVPVSVAKTAESDGEAILKVNYQVCTDFACSAPTFREFGLPLEVADAGASVKNLHPDVFSKK